MNISTQRQARPRLGHLPEDLGHGVEPHRLGLPAPPRSALARPQRTYTAGVRDALMFNARLAENAPRFGNPARRSRCHRLLESPEGVTLERLVERAGGDRSAAAGAWGAGGGGTDRHLVGRQCVGRQCGARCTAPPPGRRCTSRQSLPAPPTCTTASRRACGTAAAEAAMGAARQRASWVRPQAGHALPS